MNARSVRWLRAALLTCSAAVGLISLDSSCESDTGPAGSVGMMYTAPLPGKVHARRTHRRVMQAAPREPMAIDTSVPRRPPSGEMPRVGGLVSLDSLDTVVVLLNDNIVIPNLVMVCKQSPAIIDSLTTRRSAALDKWLRHQPSRWRIEPIDRAWLLPAICVSVRAAARDSLLLDTTVAAVEPRFVNEALPDGCLPSAGGSRPPCPNTPPPGIAWPQQVAATQANLPAYVALGFTPSRIALLDTGADMNHVLLTGGSGMGACMDCTPSTGCVPTALDIQIHGTSTAAFLAANCYYGDSLRGQSKAFVDMFQVYRPPIGPPCSGDPDPNRVDFDLNAAIRAVQAAMRRCDRTIVFETQIRCPETRILDQLAEAAFDAGAVVIAANGNGAGTAIGAPARTPGVLGVGLYNVGAPAAVGPHSHARLNGRFKPDLIAPTGYWTAKASSTHSELFPFGLTSGATPVAAAAAAELISWMQGGWVFPWMRRPSVEPGEVYAEMILAGDSPYSSNPPAVDGFDDNRGAGSLRLPMDGAGSWGSVVISPSDPPVQIGIDTSTLGASQVDAALWWHDPNEPDVESPTYGERSDFMLTINPPANSGIQAGTSDEHGGTFERARAGSLSASTPVQGWTVVISVSPNANPAWHGPRVVYWAAAAR